MHRSALVAVCMAFAVGALEAQTDDCETGFTKYDDSVFENGYGASAGGSRATYVMRFDPPPGKYWIRAVCVCWTRTNAALDFVFYDIDIWPAGDAPAFFEMQSDRAEFADPVPLYPNEVVLGRFFRSDIDFVVSGPVFIGPRWSTSTYTNFFVCSDENGPGGQAAYSGVSNADPATQIGTEQTFPNYKALGVRVKFENIFDVDGNGVVQPLNDGLLYLRWAFGFRGSTLTDGAVGIGCTRCTPEGIAYYFGGFEEAVGALSEREPKTPDAETLRELRGLIP